MAGLVFLLVLWVLAGTRQRHGLGVFLIVKFSFFYPRTTAFSWAPDHTAPSQKKSELVQ